MILRLEAETLSFTLKKIKEIATAKIKKPLVFIKYVTDDDKFIKKYIIGIQNGKKKSTIEIKCCEYINIFYITEKLLKGLK